MIRSSLDTLVGFGYPFKDTNDHKTHQYHHHYQYHYQKLRLKCVSSTTQNLKPQTHTQSSYSRSIQECINSNSFDVGKSIHAHILSTGFTPDMFLETKILMLYVRSGGENDLRIARKLFDKIPLPKNVTSWNTMILGYARVNDYVQVLELFYQMLELGVIPDKFTFPSVVKACAGVDDFDGFVKVHGLIVKSGMSSHLVVGGSLVDGYVGFELMEDAMLAFDYIDGTNVVTCNAIIGGYVKLMKWDEAWVLFSKMESFFVEPDHFTFATGLRVCAALGCLCRGKQVHSKLIVSGFENDVFVGNSLIDMYAKCKDSESCFQVFEHMRERDQVSWNTMISAQVKLGFYDEALMLIRRMHTFGYKNNRFNVGSALMACAGLAYVDAGRELHGCLVRSFLDSDTILGSILVDMYSKCGLVDKARQVFERLEHRNQVSWNSMIAGYVQEGNLEEALKLYREMELEDNSQPDQYTFTTLLGLCADQGHDDLGKQIHGHIIRMVSIDHIIIETELVHMYAKCGIMNYAQLIFDRMEERNSYSWNSLIEGYGQNDQAVNAAELFRQMQTIGIRPDCFSLASALSACIDLSNSRKGREIHGYIVRGAFEKQGILQYVLVDMYAKCGVMEYACKVYNQTREKDVILQNVMLSGFISCGRVDDARLVFEQMEEKNIISWNSILLGCTKGMMKDEAFDLFLRMQQERIELDCQTLVNLFNLCANLPALAQGKQLHSLAMKKGFVNTSVAMDSTLIDMYAKGGAITQARKFFDKMIDRNVVSWNTMITGYAKHGFSQDVLALYEQMQKEGICPSGVTYISVLSACSHTGLIEEGLNIFIAMLEDHRVDVKAEHYTCMVDLLGRAGHLEHAKEVIERMPITPEVSTWGALLGACKIHQDVDLGRYAADRLFELDPQNPGHYVIMSNIYAVAGRWKEVEEMRNMMKTRGVIKDPGVSWIEINNETQTFHAGGKSHPKTNEIYTTLRNLTSRMKWLGYVPDNKFVLCNIEDIEEEEYLLQHSERLAIALGLISLPEKSVVRVFKNLRICGDCHTVTKFISKITGRQIIVRDTNRFHHFENGVCSCGDFW